MPDNITPVGNQVKYDPMQGINMLSGVLGLKQQQQQLQIGQGEAQKSQQLMHERQSVQQMMQSGKDDQGQSIVGENGEPDPAKVLPALGRMAPLSGQQYAQNILKTHSDKIGLQESARALDMNHRNALQGIVQSVATGTDPQEAINTMRNYATQHPEAAATEKYMEGFVQHIGNAKDPEQRSHLAQSLASMMQPGQAVETRPQNASVQTATGSLQGAVAPPVAGGAFTPSSFTKRGIGPTEEPGFQGRVAASTTAASGGGSIDNQAFGNVIAAGTRATSITDLGQKIKDLASGIRTGKFTKEFADQLTVLKQHDPQATMRQVIEKYANNLKTTVEGAGSTDQERQQIGSGYPTPDTMNPAALEEAANYAIGQGRLAQERSDNAVKHWQGAKSTEGFAVKDSAFMKGKSPLGYAPKSTAAPSGRVRVKSPDGKTGTIPANRLSAYKAQGYTEAQ